MDFFICGNKEAMRFFFSYVGFKGRKSDILKDWRIGTVHKQEIIKNGYAA